MNKPIIKITYHPGTLILTLMDPRSPKVKKVGTGLLLSQFNNRDVLISNEALTILMSSIPANKSKKDIGLEVISKSSIWWASQSGGIILPMMESEINIYDVPWHTITSNDIDEKLLKLLDKK